MRTMKVITILAQKGGVGKTMTTLSIAVAAAHDDLATCVLDFDPQGSATRWSDRRKEPAPTVEPATTARLDKLLAHAKGQGADLIVIDTAPHSASEALAAARVADLVLIPCRPDILDLEAISTSIDTARIAKKPAAILFNAVPPRSAALEPARAAVARYEIEIAPIAITNRRAFSNALISGQTAQEMEPHGKAAEEIGELWAWCKKKMR